MNTSAQCRRTKPAVAALCERQVAQRERRKAPEAKPTKSGRVQVYEKDGIQIIKPIPSRTYYPKARAHIDGLKLPAPGAKLPSRMAHRRNYEKAVRAADLRDGTIYWRKQSNATILQQLPAAAEEGDWVEVLSIIREVKGRLSGTLSDEDRSALDGAVRRGYWTAHNADRWRPLESVGAVALAGLPFIADALDKSDCERVLDESKALIQRERQRIVDTFDIRRESGGTKGDEQRLREALQSMPIDLLEGLRETKFIVTRKSQGGYFSGDTIYVNNILGYVYSGLVGFTTVHEVGHAIDSAADWKLSEDESFKLALALDRRSLRRYERAEGAGETFADSFAHRYNGGPGFVKALWGHREHINRHLRRTLGPR